MKIVLIGYRCTGKSSVGEGLAKRLQLPFYDTDLLIEAGAGMSIKEMVNQSGWDFFRKKEKETVKAIGLKRDCIVATGGGVVMDRDNADILKKEGVIVWLTAEVETILGRMEADSVSKYRRPPLSGKDVGQETEDILKHRIPIYRELADFTIDTSRYGIDEAVEEIYRFINQMNA